jgi:hypothetical protein
MIERQPTVTIDKFFETPNQVRSWALSLEFFKGDRGNWPGFRTDLLHELDPEFHSLVCTKIIKHTDYNYFSKFDISFQIIDESWGQGWVHRDPREFNVVGVIYLTPNPPLGNQYGTIIYDDPENFNSDEKIFIEDVNELDSEKRKLWNNERIKYNNHFRQNTIVENRYNRCIIFDARQWHSAGNFFGQEGNVETSRLTAVFFGDAKK